MRRRLLWLAGAVLLFALAAWLMSRSDRPEGGRRDRAVAFPRYPRPPEFERMSRRRTLPPAVGATPRYAGEELRRDPVLVALPSGPGRTAVVAEASALAHSPVGEMLLRCLAAESRGDPFAELQRQTGIDPVRDVDRVAVFDDGVLVSGHFQAARWDELLKGTTATTYGGATLYAPAAGAGEGPTLAVWGGSMVIAGKPDAVRGAVDRLEGRAPPGPPPLADNEAYGDVYGVVGAQLLGTILGGAQPGLQQQFRDAAERVELHVDASGDVAMVARVRGSAPAQVEDLGKTLGAALAVARVKAQADGERDLAELLDYARVRPDGASFTMELALPQAFLEKQLAHCGRRGPESQPASAPASAPVIE